MIDDSHIFWMKILQSTYILVHFVRNYQTYINKLINYMNRLMISIPMKRFFILLLHKQPVHAICNLSIASKAFVYLQVYNLCQCTLSKTQVLNMQQIYELTWGIGMTPPSIGGGAPTMYGIGGMPGMPIGVCPGYDISFDKLFRSLNYNVLYLKEQNGTPVKNHFLSARHQGQQQTL